MHTLGGKGKPPRDALRPTVRRHRMCYPVECPRCHKTTWGGCGEHVAEVMRTVPTAQQCTCDTQR